jgi:hypothetical protein
MNWNYFYLFFQSNLLEVVFLIYFYRQYLSTIKITALVTVCNSITHPIVIFIILKNSSLSFMTSILLAEAFAIVAEMILHKYATKMTWKSAFTGSLLANLLSWQLGPILTTVVFMREHL